MPYLNVTEVESALSVAASAPYTAFTQLIPLPTPTWEGRSCNAIKIANGTGSERPGVYFLGGIHSREWGSSDILINFIEQLEQAYQTGSSITIGSRTFSVDDIQRIVNSLDLVVFPQANPDGRNYSMTLDAMWRKNRRTSAPNSAACAGVDLNRNYDFLWNFPVYFDPAAAISDSTSPCDYEVYHGPAAFSEPETQNAKWIFDNFPNIGFFVDLHSFGEDILYTWGDDEDQTSNANMNFRNPAFNGSRGIAADAYQEYIPSNDLATALDLANSLSNGIQAFRGRTYTVESAYNLYPTAGTGHDYSFSRHFTDSTKQNIIGYTLEWGSGANPTPFHPAYPEMQNIIQEVTCGLLSFCLRVCDRMANDFYVRDWTDSASIGDNGVQPSTHAVFYATSDVWNRRGTLPGPFPSDQPSNEDAGNGSADIGDNWAFARIRRNVPGGAASQAVNAHFLVSKFGTGSPYADASSLDPDITFGPDQSVTFDPAEVGAKITPPMQWHLNAIASTHLCLGVEITGPSDPFIAPSLVGNTPGWPVTDLRIINDNNKAQRNMGLSTTPARGAGGDHAIYALAHNAAPFIRDMEVRYRIPAEAAGLFKGAVLETINGKVGNSTDPLDEEVGGVVARLDGTEYRQVLRDPGDGSIHITPDGRAWVAVHEGVSHGTVIQTPFTVHWKGPGSEDRQEAIQREGSILLPKMQPGEDRWIGLRFPAPEAKGGQTVVVNFFEMVDGVPVNGFGVGARTASINEVLREKLERHRSVFTRAAALQIGECGAEQVEAALKLLNAMATPQSGPLDGAVGKIVAILANGTEYRQVLLGPADGEKHVTPDGRTWIAVHEGVVNGQVVVTPFTLHWRGTVAPDEGGSDFEPDYLKFLESQVGGMKQIAEALIASMRNQDPFGVLAGVDAVAEAAQSGEAGRAAVVHGGLLNKLDSAITARELLKGDVAGTLQNVRWQASLYRSNSNLDPAGEVVAKSDEFIANYGVRIVSNKDYPPLLESLLPVLSNAVGLFPSVDLGSAIQQIGKELGHLKGLQKAHREFLLRLQAAVDNAVGVSTAAAN